MQVSAFIYGLSGVIVSLNTILIGIRFLVRYRSIHILTNLTFGVGFVLLSAAWWPPVIEFMGLAISPWLLRRIGTLLFIPGMWIICYGINRIFGYTILLDFLVFLLGIPLYIIVLFWAELYVYIVNIGGLYAIKYSLLCSILLLMNILFLIWHVGIRFIRYGLPEKDKIGKIKALFTGTGFVIWGCMAVIDSTAIVPVVLLIDRCGILIAQYIVLLGQLWPNVVIRVFTHLTHRD